MILVILGVRGCLNARKTRSFENFASDVNAIAAQGKQVSDSFLSHLKNPTSGNQQLDISQELASDESQADALLTRVDQLSAPGELSGAKSNLVLAYELRRDGIAGVADQVAHVTAKSSKTAPDAMVKDMEQVLAGDVIYSRAQADADTALQDQGVDQKIADSVFLPDPTTWLNPAAFAPVLSAAGSKATAATCNSSQSHGTGLVSIDGVSVTPGTQSTITATSADSLDVGVQNQGTATESSIQVTGTVQGGGHGTGRITNLAAGATGTAAVKFQPAPSSGQQVTVTISVLPVPCERVTSNNKGSFLVTFP